MIKSIIQRLKKQGFPDRAVLDMNPITSYYNLVNRGLGLKLEEDSGKGYNY